MENNIYNLPFYISKINKRKLQKVRFKEIVLDLDVPTSYDEVHYKEIYDSYIYLMNNLKSNIDISFFIKSYFLLSNKRISKNTAYKILAIYYQYKDCDIVELLYLLLKEVNKYIRKYRLEYNLLLINYFFKRLENEEIIIYQSMLNLLKTMLRSSENIMIALLMFKKSVNNLNSNQYDNKLTKNEIIDFLNTNKSTLTKRFLIKNIFLFGSFAENTHHDKSDLDLLVIFNDSITKSEKIMLIKKMKEFIENKLKISTDVIDFENALKSMDFMSLNKILTIY